MNKQRIEWEAYSESRRWIVLHMKDEMIFFYYQVLKLFKYNLQIMTY